MILRWWLVEWSFVERELLVHLQPSERSQSCSIRDAADENKLQLEPVVVAPGEERHECLLPRPLVALLAVQRLRPAQRDHEVDEPAQASIQVFSSVATQRRVQASGGWAAQWAHCVRVLRRSSTTASFFAKNDALRDGKSYAHSTRQAQHEHYGKGEGGECRAGSRVG